ncbi:MAG: hypothetical protein J0I20_29665 [Chloroflexi bacterium]|nr:hypothetical protein [Chloroflexota bacterium]
MVAGFAVVSALGLSTGAALAHETRDVDGGKYQLRVGFIDEPAYQGLQNGLELTVCNGQCSTKPDSNGVLANGVTGAFDTLKAEVIYGPSTMPLTLVAVPYQPGKYDAMFVPTRTGNYTFHISGTLNSDKIDERFTSSPDTFDSVQPLTVVQFPDKPGFEQGGSVGSVTVTAATPVATPGGSTATTVAATSAVTTNPTASAATPASGTSTGAVPAGASASDVQALQQQLAAQQQALDTAKNNASSANTLGLVGLIVGILGLLVAGVALFMSRSKGNGGSPKPRREVEGG